MIATEYDYFSKPKKPDQLKALAPFVSRVVLQQHERDILVGQVKTWCDGDTDCLLFADENQQTPHAPLPDRELTPIEKNAVFTAFHDIYCNSVKIIEWPEDDAEYVSLGTQLTPFTALQDRLHEAPTAAFAFITDIIQDVAKVFGFEDVNLIDRVQRQCEMAVVREEDTAAKERDREDDVIAKKLLAFNDAEQEAGNIQGPDGMKWQDARDNMLRLRIQSQNYTSERALAEQLGCNKLTIKKAIDNTPSLRAWRALKEDKPAKPLAVALTDELKENFNQTKESNPFEAAEAAEMEAALTKLKDHATPVQMEDYKTMPREKLFTLAAAVEEQDAELRNEKRKKIVVHPQI